MVDPDRFQAAAGRFVAFFRELEGTFVERDDLLQQIALALLAREHVLITGPPGTAKSQIASAVLRRILSERTGAPSVFTRQFTESTVQTDLVGPIDFKTLLETGRTEHFTDEGMLGSVHAFLDEVFDGRDMLLRSALNILHERELKQGGRTTLGQIECAVMTSNRYLAEIIEGSRETLLAFIDRIAFVNFVPKGFADASNLALVLRRSLNGAALRLNATLSVEDLDALQAVTDDVPVHDGACNALALLLEMIESETAAAMKADPSFLPTRYLSTRTAVRAGRVLRAICVYDKLFVMPDRRLEVQARDFARLRLHLVLGGLPPEQTTRLLGREMDPRERRQLQILRTEREIFDRCVARLPPVPPPPPRPRAADAKGLDAIMQAADLRALGAPELVAAARQLAAATLAGAPGADRAAKLFRDAASTLGERALRAGLSPELEDLPHDVARQMAVLADSLEEIAPSMRALACWLRGRALWLLDQTAATPGVSGEAAALAASGEDARKLAAAAEERVAALERLAAMRHDLVAKGAPAPQDDTGWRRAALRAEEELALLLDGSFRRAVAKVLDERPDDVLARLAPALHEIDAFGARLNALGAPPAGLKMRVCGPRLQPILRAVFPAHVIPVERAGFVEKVEALLRQLRASGLEAVLPPIDLLTWSAEALVGGGDSAAGPPPADADQTGYNALMARQGPTALSTLVDVVTRRLWPELQAGHEQPAELTRRVAQLFGELDATLREQACALDVERATQTLAYLERWWGNLKAAPRAGLNAAETVSRIEAVVQSGFLRVVRDEAAPARTAAALRVLADMVPGCDAKAHELAARAGRLEDACTSHLVALLTQRSDAAWAEVLRKPGGA